MQIEKRYFKFDVRSETDEKNGSFLRGRPIVYDSRTNLGDFDEIIKAGALDDADLSDVKFLINHNTMMIPLARSKAGDDNSTMKFTVDKKGMDISVNIDSERNADAKSLNSAVERGDLDGMSFMFTIDGQEWEGLETDHPTRTITKIGKVFEVSAVTFPAYADTELSTRSKDILAAARQERKQENKSSDLELEKLKVKYLYNI